MTAPLPADLELAAPALSASSKRKPLCRRTGYATCFAITIALFMPIALLCSAGAIRTSRKEGQVPHLLQLAGSSNACRRASSGAGAFCGAADRAIVTDLDVSASSSLPLDVAVLLFRQLARADSAVFGEILKGAHVSIPDPDHTVYSFLANLTKPGERRPAAYPRPSSHHSDTQQLGLDLGRQMVTLLVGTKGDNTWLQLEADAFKPHGGQVWNSLFHGIDFFIYRFTGKNVGPMGLSIHTDRNPLVCHLVDAQEACPDWC